MTGEPVATETCRKCQGGIHLGERGGLPYWLHVNPADWSRDWHQAQPTKETPHGTQL